MAKFVLSHLEVQTRLVAAGIAVAPSVTAETVSDIRRAVKQLRPPVVLKASGLVHKSDLGGIVMGLNGPEAAEMAGNELLAKVGTKALPFVVQEEIRGLEMLLGARRDPELGIAIVVGLGGVDTEIHRDLWISMAPVDRIGVLEMLRQLRCWPLLDGYRGGQKRDVETLVNSAIMLSNLIVADPDILEIDLNPVMVGADGQGATVVDARIICDSEIQPAARRTVNLDRMLRPEHVVVVGVSGDSRKPGARLFRYLAKHGFAGRIDAVRPGTGASVAGEYARSLTEISGSPDLVCIAVPSRFVPEIVQHAVLRRVGGVIVHSSDFAETGEAGRAAQVTLARVLSEAGIPLIGPNSMGIVAPHERLVASIAAGLEEATPPGGVAVLTSSGALGSCLASRLKDASVGMSYWIHAGNEADTIIADYLEWLCHDDRTTVVGLVLEDIKAGARFIEAGRRLARAGIPMFAHVLGRSHKGRDAVLSHTGAMVGSVEMREAVLRAARVVSVPSLAVLEDAIILSAMAPLPKGDRLAGITFSGGACSIIADACEEEGVALPELSSGVRTELEPLLPGYAAIRNPLDVSYQTLTMDENFERIVEIVATSGAFDAVLVQFTTNADPHAESLARKVVAVRDRVDVPIYISRYGAWHLAPLARKFYKGAGIYVMDAPDRACRALGALMRVRRLQQGGSDGG